MLRMLTFRLSLLLAFACSLSGADRGNEDPVELDLDADTGKGKDGKSKDGKGKDGKDGKADQDDSEARPAILFGTDQEHAKVMVISANTDYQALDGPALARLFEEAIPKVAKAYNQKLLLQLDVSKLGEEDSSKNWFKIRLALDALSPDLIVIGCQECTTVEGQKTALQLLACSHRLGDKPCEDETPPQGGPDFISAGLGARYKSKDEFYANGQSKEGMPAKSMIYQGILVRQGSIFEKAKSQVGTTVQREQPQGADCSGESAQLGQLPIVNNDMSGDGFGARPSSKGAVISSLLLPESGFSLTLASTQLEGGDAAARNTEMNLMLSKFKALPEGLTLVYGDLNHRLYGYDKKGKRMVNGGESAPDHHYYFEKLKKARGPEAGKMYNALKSDDSLTSSWEKSPFNEVGFEIINFTENVPPTYRVKGLSRLPNKPQQGPNIEGQMACHLLGKALEEAESEDALEVKVNSCYELTSTTQSCDDGKGGNALCADFGWLDRMLSKTTTPLHTKVFTTLGWYPTPTENGLGEHSPLLYFGTFSLPPKNDASKDEKGRPKRRPYIPEQGPGGQEMKKSPVSEPEMPVGGGPAGFQGAGGGAMPGMNGGMRMPGDMEGGPASPLANQAMPGMSGAGGLPEAKGGSPALDGGVVGEFE
eukprot:TRINITY_DN121720_c0_g1_i1.p1 TRINITY_DN121720_c0_g1~~TRINITY_DN121720_c0_g1_i1.p1  ORF type:complete len:650 (+),score=189.28 TRINITY_DN121720_c0_g1_i1:119-2068(+)